MSGDPTYPPPGGYPPPGPGWGSPPPPPPGWDPPQGGVPPWGVAPPVRAAHKPGAVPLRPLGLGDMYDAAFKIIRSNPRATVGSALLISTVAMFVPLLVTVALAGAFDLSTSLSGEQLSEAEAITALGGPVALGIGTLLQSVGLIFVTGMVCQVTAAAAVGRRIGLAEAWAATRGRRWRLLGLAALYFLVSVLLFAGYVLLWVLVVLTAETLVIVLWGLVTVPAFVVLLIWTWTRVYCLSVPALMLERIGVFAAFGRAYRLTAGQFWRTFGIALLTAVITAVAGQLLAVPFAFGAVLVPLVVTGLTGAYVGMVLQALGSVLAAAFVTPFTAAVTSLQYVDQRMRKEGYDLELMTEAGIGAP